MDSTQIAFTLGGAVIAGLITGFLGGPLALLISPSFEIEYEESSRIGCAQLEKYANQETCPNEEEHQMIEIEKITIKNKGLVQAKNIEINFISTDPFWIASKDCPEGDIDDFEQQEELRIKFDRFSTNLNCFIEFESINPKSIQSITVTADETPGYRWSYGEMVESNINYIWTLLLISIVIPTGFLIFIGYKIIQIFRERRGYKKSMLEKESETISELNSFNSELDFLDKAISMQEGKDVPVHTLKRRESLIKKIVQLTNVRDKLRTTMSTQIDTREQTGEFFELWIDLERTLLDLVEKVSDSKMRTPTFKYIMDELQSKKVLDKSIIQELEPVRKFRNNLIHAVKQYTSEELQTTNSNMKQLLNTIQAITPPVQFYISIPKGSSVPGCEKDNKCFLPPKLTIRENQTVVWNNDDSAAHTVTSGDPADAESIGTLFDSSLILSGNSFAHKYTKKGIHPYCCVVHPWQKGVIEVK